MRSLEGAAPATTAVFRWVEGLRVALLARFFAHFFVHMICACYGCVACFVCLWRFSCLVCFGC